MSEKEVSCTIHLISLKSNIGLETFLGHLVKSATATRPYIIRGRPHGWVHRPHGLDVEQLTGTAWDLFLLTDTLDLPSGTNQLMEGHVFVKISVPSLEFNKLLDGRDSTPSRIEHTPPLPSEWPQRGGIPTSTILQGTPAPLKPGELRLDEAMASFLSNALPQSVRNKPVSLFNLFKYPKGDRTVHDAYMDGFRLRFGPAAGAQVKFMGPVNGSISAVHGEGVGNDTWDDANLVQYDSIWHYAYMLSTEIYADLNQEKMRGLEDTCILCVSEVEIHEAESRK